MKTQLLRRNEGGAGNNTHKVKSIPQHLLCVLHAPCGAVLDFGCFQSTSRRLVSSSRHALSHLSRSPHQAGVSPLLLPFHFLLLLFCPSSKSIQNQPNPASGKPAPTRLHPPYKLKQILD
uniref:Uncharacterized protein n=1 Tax=Knipowitschia caucasica TaxID=637954 RepID=A0AAV2MSI3_KNICA